MTQENTEFRTIGTMTVPEFIQHLRDEGYELTPLTNDTRAFLTGVKELASFLNMSISSAQRKLSKGEFDYCVYRTGQIILIDKNKLLEGMKANKQLTRKYRKH